MNDDRELNQQLNTYLDGKSNWGACEEYVLSELSDNEDSTTLGYDIYMFMRHVSSRFNIKDAEVKEIIIETLKETL